MILVRHFWVFFVAVTCANAYVWWRRSQLRQAQDPGLAIKQRSFIKAWLLIGNLAWLVMGSGIVFGQVPTVWNYLDPLSDNRWITAFYATVIAIWMVGAVRNGCRPFGLSPANRLGFAALVNERLRSFGIE